jgi:hypothetical protein
MRKQPSFRKARRVSPSSRNRRQLTDLLYRRQAGACARGTFAEPSRQWMACSQAAFRWHIEFSNARGSEGKIDDSLIRRRKG